VSSIPDLAMLEIIKELAAMICAEREMGKTCIERMRNYRDCCLVCKARILLELPEIMKR